MSEESCSKLGPDPATVSRRVLSKADLAYIRSVPDPKNTKTRERLLDQMLRIRTSKEFAAYERDRKQIAKHQQGGKVGGKRRQARDEA